MEAPTDSHNIDSFDGPLPPRPIPPKVNRIPRRPVSARPPPQLPPLDLETMPLDVPEIAIIQPSPSYPPRFGPGTAIPFRIGNQSPDRLLMVHDDDMRDLEEGFAHRFDMHDMPTPPPRQPTPVLQVPGAFVSPMHSRSNSPRAPSKLRSEVSLSDTKSDTNDIYVGPEQISESGQKSGIRDDIRDSFGRAASTTPAVSFPRKLEVDPPRPGSRLSRPRRPASPGPIRDGSRGRSTVSRNSLVDRIMFSNSPSSSRGQSPSPSPALKYETSMSISPSPELLSTTPSPRRSWAFVVGGHADKRPYDIDDLSAGRPCRDVWTDFGDLLVYLGDRGKRIGPSFRIPSRTIEDSPKLKSMLVTEHFNGNIDERYPKPRFANPEEAARIGPITPVDVFSSGNVVHKLFLPLNLPHTDPISAPNTMESLVLMRNLFAFLNAKLLIGTPGRANIVSILTSIAALLNYYEFSDPALLDLGIVPTMNFLGYVRDLEIEDVRKNPRKAVEAMLLGEKFHCWPLYREGFTHAVGMHDSLQGTESHLLKQLSTRTQHRIHKAAHNLHNIKMLLHDRLEKFEIPSLFSGIANSTSANKLTDFKSWHSSYNSMRLFVISYLKTRFGDWPIAAAAKAMAVVGHSVERVILQEVYADFCDLYDCLVDKESLSPRLEDVLGESEDGSTDIISLRKLLTEFDKSAPPGYPPLPFDIPRLPNLAAIRRGFSDLPQHKQEKEMHKKMKNDEINMALMQSCNKEHIKATSFIQSFMAFERRNAEGMSSSELAKARIGQWIFIYVIVQSLPSLVVDASGVQFTEHVGYPLCQGPTGHPPWYDALQGLPTAYAVLEDDNIKTMQFETVEEGIIGNFHRSHCWQRAIEWQNPSDHTSWPYEERPVSTVSSQAHTPVEGRSRSPFIKPELSELDSQPWYDPMIPPPVPAKRSTANPDVTFESIMVKIEEKRRLKEAAATVRKKGRKQKGSKEIPEASERKVRLDLDA